MRCHKLNGKISVNLIYVPKQVGKIITDIKVFAIRIDVLPEQRYLFISLGNKSANFFKNVFGSAASFASANIRHYAI